MEELSMQMIKAIGHFLVYYESDLRYIAEFKNFKEQRLSIDEYLSQSDHSFTAFLTEFKIIRNISKEEQETALRLAKRWCKGANCDNVDLFAKKIKDSGISWGNLPLSFASKILFLNNPANIIPLDRRSKAALNLSKENYQGYLNAIRRFEKENKEVIAYCLDHVADMAKSIEENFNQLHQSKTIRKNRMIDKLLWVMGGQ